ncbi:MAG: hypothetical protein QM536_02815 [Chitinophagaceae bacterium]|nr:hypothetical protein [Chitinophagaceae bacterium]
MIPLDAIKEFTKEIIRETDIFIIDIITSGANNTPKITLLLETERGITIDECAFVNKKILHYIDTHYPNETYTLEVSSPGIDYPIQFLVQYKRNRGRNIEVLLRDETKYRGKLLSVDETSIDMLTAKEKNKTETEIKILLTDIYQAKNIIT